MLRNTKLVCILTLAAAALLAVGCEGGSTTNKNVTVSARGKAVTASSRAVSSMELASGSVAINGNPVALQSVDTTNSNTATFEGTVSVEVPTARPVVQLSANPKAGFVFDEWELDEEAIKKDPTVSKSSVRLTDEQEELFTIEVDADHVKFYIASFEPGFYVDLTNGDDTTGDGSSAKPVKTLSHALSLIDAAIAAGNATSTDEDDDYDEFVLVISGTSAEDVVLSQNVGVSLKGGFDSAWAPTATPTTIGNVKVSGSETDEIELSNLSIATLTLSAPIDELEGCTIGNLNVAGSTPVVIANTIFTGVIAVPAPSVFVNCVFESTASLTLSVHMALHSMFDAALLPSFASNSKNNIVIDATQADGVVGKNYSVDSRQKFTGYITDNAQLVTALGKAPAFTEAEVESFEDQYDVDDDYIEEDITGFERPEAEDATTVLWSYGPYEYHRK